MRKFPVLFTLLVLLLSTLQSGFAQQTRPRRVGQTPPGSTTTTTTTTGEQQRDEPQGQPAPGRRPPVLGGANNTGPTSGAPQTQTQTPSNDEQVELGEGDILRISTTLVTIPVSVLDRNGKYVPNLRQQDFTIFEDGVQQDVAYFASVEKPFTVALVLDTSGSMLSRKEEIQEAAIAFVNQLRPDDRVMIVSFDDRVRVLAEPTSDRYTLSNAIRRTESGEGTSLYDAVDLVINERFNRISGRKAIVLFTDGVDTTSRRATYDSNVRDAEELDALIYPIQYDTYQDVSGGGGGGISYPSNGTLGDILGSILMGRTRGMGRRGGIRPGSRGTSREEYELGAQYLRDVAQKTGTRVQEAADPRYLTQAFSVIAEELRRQYSLGYYPKAEAQAGQRRQIRVRVRQPNLVVRARDSYIFSGQSNSGTDQSSKQQPQMRNRQQP